MLQPQSGSHGIARDKKDTMMHYLKKHPSNIYSGLGILVGLLIIMLGALLNPLVTGIVIAVLSALALVFSVKENKAAETEAQKQEQAMERWKGNTQLRIDFESATNAPGFEHQARWEAFDKQYPDWRSSWSLQPGEVRKPISGQAPVLKRGEEEKI